MFIFRFILGPAIGLSIYVIAGYLFGTWRSKWEFTMWHMSVPGVSSTEERIAALRRLEELMPARRFRKFVNELVYQGNGHSWEVVVALHQRRFSELGNYLKVVAMGPPHDLMLFFKGDREVTDTLEEMLNKPFSAKTAKTLEPIMRIMLDRPVNLLRTLVED